MIAKDRSRHLLPDLIRWVPRILCILFAVFISLFSFDVFGEQAGFLKALSAFLIHNIPTLLIFTILLFSWKRSWIGGISFIILGIIYLIWFSGNTKYLFFYLPLFTIDTLFLSDWFMKNQIWLKRDL